MKITWDDAGKRYYETGVKKGVFYLQDESGAYPQGIAWNGLISVTESPSGAEATPLYADDTKYLNLRSAEEFGATLEAYTYPDEFTLCDGSSELVKGVTIGQQMRRSFGLCYVTSVGNDIVGNDFGYKIHIIYGATAAPSEKSYSTINDSPEAITFSWELSTVPVHMDGFKPTASLVVDSTKVSKEKMEALEKVLYGDDTESSTPRLPLPSEIATIIGTGA